MSAPAPSIPGRITALLRQPPFARYMAGETISMTGTWMQVMAQNWVIATLTDRAIVLGLLNFAGGIPMVALSMLGGSCADRYDKRNILLATQVVQIALALGGGWLVGTGQIRIWHLLIGAVLLGISNSFEMPAASALVPELVGRRNVATAIAIDRAVFHGTRLVGPALAGYIIGLWGSAAAFYSNAFSFVALIVALLTLHPRKEGTPEEEAQRRGGIRQGIQYVRSDRPTLAMIALMAASTVFVFPVIVVLLPLYSKNVLLLGPDKLGLLMGVSGIGSLTGSLGLLAVPPAKRRGIMLAAVTGISLALAGLSQARQFGFAALCLIFQSLSVSTLIGLANTIVQERAPALLRGRVSAVAGLSFFGLMPFASLGLTGIADVIGIRTALLSAAICYIVVGTYVLLGPGRRLGELTAAPPLPQPPFAPATTVILE
jgi:MFS family permease